MKIKVSKASVRLIDLLVGKIEGHVGPDWRFTDEYCDSLRHDQDGLFCEDWAQGGPISERNGISSQKKHDGWWLACIYNLNDEGEHYQVSHNRLEAEMRCYVASKLGNEVEVPDELI